MRKAHVATALLLTVFCMASGVAQTPGAGGGDLVLKPIAATSGTGVSNVPLLNRDEVRVLRVDIEPNGVRNIHTHDDVKYHLFIPISGPMQFHVDGEKPLDVAQWQGQFIKGGTRHGFRNTGSSKVTVMEVFVR